MEWLMKTQKGRDWSTLDMSDNQNPNLFPCRNAQICFDIVLAVA